MNSVTEILEQETIITESHAERLAGLSFKNKSRISEAISILGEVEDDTWLLNWTAEQEQDLAEATTRLIFLLQSISEKQEQEAA